MRDYLAKISHYGNSDGDRMHLNAVAEENVQNSLMEETKNQNNSSEERIYMGRATANGGVDESAEQNNSIHNFSSKRINDGDGDKAGSQSTPNGSYYYGNTA